MHTEVTSICNSFVKYEKKKKKIGAVVLPGDWQELKHLISTTTRKHNSSEDLVHYQHHNTKV